MNLNKKKKILILSPRFPYPHHKGDQLVIYHCIKFLSSSYDIDLITFYDQDLEDKNYDIVKQYCNKIVLVKQNKFNTYFQVFKSLFNNTSIQVAYFYSSIFKNKLKLLLKNNKYDLLFPFTLRVSQYVENIDTNKYIHLIDSMYLNMKRRSENEKGIKKLIFNYESYKVQKYEKSLINKYDKLFLVSKIDKDIIDKNNNSIKVFPNGVNIYKDGIKKLDNNKLIIIFTGNMGYFPNQDAVLWFVKNCWHRILESLPNTIFRIVGKNPSIKIKNLSVNYNNIEVIGFVDSIEEELLKANISIAPMQSGSGMQNKILEAMSVKIPVVTTSLGLGDIKAINKKDILLADTKDEFINEIKYLTSIENQKYIGENGFDFVEKNHSWDSIIKTNINL